MVSSMPELKRCPFCGGQGVVEMDESWYWEYEAYCMNCTATLGHFNTKAEAIEAWNTRKDG
jgi:Lar family restriction alleviation protein